LARVDPHNRTHFWRDRRVPGLNLLHADFTRHDYAPHFHEALVVAVTELGGSEFNSRGRTEEAGERALLVFNPAEPHSGRMGRSDRWRYRSFYLSPPAIAAIMATLGVDAEPYFSRNLFTDPDLVAAFLALHRALDEGRDPWLERELLVDSFGTLIRRHADIGRRVPAAPHDRAAFGAIAGLMRDRHAEPLSLDTLGQAAGLTPFQLIRLFKRTAGLTPHAYLSQIRLQAATQGLASGLPIAEVALASGFYDQAALTRHFKRAYGITPRHYAAAMAG
jgi:AraC-like DNA-binding protein